MKKTAAFLALILAFSCSPRAFSIESVQNIEPTYSSPSLDSKNSPITYYASDFESAPSTSQGNFFKIIYCFSYIGTPEGLAPYCPATPFAKRFNKIVVNFPKQVKIASLTPPAINLSGAGSGFVCSNNSQFNFKVDEDKHAISFSGFNCQIESPFAHSGFGLGGYISITSNAALPFVFTISSTLTTTDGQSIVIKLAGKQYPLPESPPGFSFPHGIPCAAVVAQGSHYCLTYMP